MKNTYSAIMKLGLQTVSMPQAGLGTWAAGQTNDSAEVEATIEAALEAGVRLIDTATVYLNEAAIGKALKKCMDAGKFIDILIGLSKLTKFTTF